MKTLSIKQPWAHLIVSGLKDIENRSWKTHYRGKILVHASQAKAGSTIFYLNEKQIKEVKKNVSETELAAIIEGDFKYSAIIGEVEIVDCVQNSKSIWAEPGQWHWVLANPVMYAIPFVNVKGKLSFWEYEPVINGTV